MHYNVCCCVIANMSTLYYNMQKVIGLCPVIWCHSNVWHSTYVCNQSDTKGRLGFTFNLRILFSQWGGNLTHSGTLLNLSGNISYFDFICTWCLNVVNLVYLRNCHHPFVFNTVDNWSISLLVTKSTCLFGHAWLVIAEY